MPGPRQHQIPQFYLRPFLSPGWVYRRYATGPRKVKNPKDVAVSSDYYGRRGLDNMNSFIESECADSIGTLIKQSTSMIDLDRFRAAFLVANLWIRSPATLDMIRSTNAEFLKQGREIWKRQIAFQESGGTIPEASDFLQPGPSYRTTMDCVEEHIRKLESDAGHLVVGLGAYKSMLEIGEIVDQMRWQVVVAPKGCFFITSDRPVIITSSFRGIVLDNGWSNPDATAMVALRPDHLLLMSSLGDRDIGVATASPENMRDLNALIIASAPSQVFSSLPYQPADSILNKT